MSTVAMHVPAADPLMICHTIPGSVGGVAVAVAVGVAALVDAVVLGAVVVVVVVGGSTGFSGPPHAGSAAIVITKERAKTRLGTWAAMGPR